MSDPEMSATNAEANQVPAVIYVTYAGPADSRFDREYYVEQHLPLVLRAWEPHGLLSVAAFFPASKAAGTLAVCECRFSDERAIEQSFAAPETAGVMADLRHFTDLPASRSRVVAI